MSGATEVVMDAAVIAKSERIELDMLRAFYQSWIGLHKIPRDKLHRKKQEVAAQLLVDNAHTLQRFLESQQPEKPALHLVPANGS